MDVAEAEADGDGVEAGVGEGQVHSVAHYFGDVAVFTCGEHALGEIAGDDPGAGFCEFFGGYCGACGKVEDFFTRFEVKAAAGAGTPQFVLSERQHGVGDVVVFADVVKHAGDVFGVFV